MAGPDSLRPSADTSTAWQLMHLSYRLGFMQAKNDRDHARTQSMVKEVLGMLEQTEPPPPSGLVQTLASRWRARAADFVLLHKVWSAWRAISWPVSLGVWGSAVAKFLGLW